MNNLIDGLNRRITEKGLSQTAIARAIDISPTALSQWLGRRYKGDNERIDKAVEGFLKKENEREKAPKRTLEFVMISTASKVFEALDICHLDGEIGVIYGNAGLGKTFAAKEYATRNSGVILVEADLGYTARDLFSELHKKCGGDGNSTINRMKDDIISRLKGSGRLIVVDEAEHLPVRAVDLLRRINDKAGTGIVFIGLGRLWDALKQKKNDYAYIFSRIGLVVSLDPLQPKDVEDIINRITLNSNGIWRSYYKNSGKNARILSKLVARSLRIAELNNGPVTPEIIEQSAKMLVI